MAKERIETLVIGGGAMGSAAAWQLARRSREVVLIERFGPGHTMGASHGASRNFNLSYANPAYLELLAEALPLWRELERESGLADGMQAGRPILDQVGIVNHGGNPAFDDVSAALSSAGFHSEFLEPAEAERRWPGINFDQRVLFTPEAGRLDADLAVAALQERVAASTTGTVQHFTRANRLTVVDEDHVLVQTETRDASGMLTATVTYDARRVIVTVGAWTSTLLAGSPSAAVTLPRLVVTQEQPAHFAVLDDTHQWPGFNHVPDVADAAYDWWPSPIYGMFTPGQGVRRAGTVSVP